MRWVVISALSLIAGCSGESSDEAPPTPFSGAPSTTTAPVAPEAPPADTPAPNPGADVSSTSEDPAAGIAGGVIPPSTDPGTFAGAAPVAPATPAEGMPADPVDPPATEPTPPEPAAPAVQTSLPTTVTGCGKSTPAGEFSLPLNGANAAFTITLPPNYDPNTPAPLVFAFHGRNQTHILLRTQDAAEIQTALGGTAIMAYLKSQAGPGWNFPEEVEPNVAFFEAVYERALADYCVDSSRIFAVGHSSGGYFSNILACRYGDVLRGIGSVAGNTQEFDCIGRVAAIVVHGVRDSVVSFAGGQESRDIYLATNECSGQSAPFSVAPCIVYQGCSEGLPVAWCEHAEPPYDNTNHGWPSFASRALGQFLFSLPARP